MNRSFPAIGAARIILVAGLFLCTCFASLQAEEKTDPSNRFNILFIAVDDLRPELGCYGAKHALSPNIDKLAASGRLYRRHYVQVATCGASRYALLTGRRTSESGAYQNNAFTGGPCKLSATRNKKAAQTLPELFRRSGYHTTCIGKISHHPDGRVFAYDGRGDGRPEVPHAWDDTIMPTGKWKRGWGTFFAYAGGRHREDKSGYRPVMEFPDVADDELPDGMIADAAEKALERHQDQRFFLAVGFFKPHLPFVAPKRYWDLYENRAVPLAANPKRGSAHFHGSGEFYKYDAPYKKSRPLADEDARTARRAYLACVSYADAQVGKVLDKLAELKLEEKTIVVLWGDHGWHLGDNQIWGKHTPLEYANRSPLIIRVPGMKQPGAPTNAIAETLDIFPTLVDKCRPGFTKSQFTLGGTSLSPSLDDPADAGKAAAISYWREAVSVRTKHYRAVFHPKKPTELYDHRIDPHEARNRAADLPEVVERLQSLAK